MVSNLLISFFINRSFPLLQFPAIVPARPRQGQPYFRRYEQRRPLLQRFGMTLAQDAIAGIEERDEAVPYSTLCLVAGAFDCDPIDLVYDETRNGRARENDLKDGEPVVTYDERFRLE